MFAAHVPMPTFVLSTPPRPWPGAWDLGAQNQMWWAKMKRVIYNLYAVDVKKQELQVGGNMEE